MGPLYGWTYKRGLFTKLVFVLATESKRFMYTTVKKVLYIWKNSYLHKKD